MGHDSTLFDYLPRQHPAQFAELSPYEQGWRGRLYLMTWSLGAPEDLAWAMALNDNEPHNTESMALVADADDDVIVKAFNARKTKDANEFFDRLLEESRSGAVPSRVTVLVPSPRPTS